jgi:Uma2 family endonuclease
MVQLQLKQISILPGQRIVLRDISWSEFEAILEELGEHRGTRIAYSNKLLEIRMPLPEHEVSKEIIGDLVKILLEELEMDCECFGSSTFKREDMAQGIEPDQCFYIQNHAVMRGKRRVDLQIDPPPDLAIEVDVTSKTQLDAYQALGVSELWCYRNRKLLIYILQDGQYAESTVSPTFPGLSILELISEFVDHSETLGRSPALRAFRLRIKELLKC